jgi:hypothetical protein
LNAVLDCPQPYTLNSIFKGIFHILYFTVRKFLYSTRFEQSFCSSSKFIIYINYHIYFNIFHITIFSLTLISTIIIYFILIYRSPSRTNFIIYSQWITVTFGAFRLHLVSCCSRVKTYRCCYDAFGWMDEVRWDVVIQFFIVFDCESTLSVMYES